MSSKFSPEARFKAIVQGFSSYPTWMTESLFLYLRDRLKEIGSLSRLNNQTSKDNIYLYIPRLSRNAQYYIQSTTYEQQKVDKKLVAFLEEVKKHKTIVDLAQDNAMTLKVCCKNIIKCWEMNLILPTYSKNIYALVRFIAAEISLADYLVRIGRISKDQYSLVEKMQSTGMASAFEDDSNMEDMFVNLGYISNDELYFVKKILGIAEQKVLYEDPTLDMIFKLQAFDKQAIAFQKDVEKLEKIKNSLTEEVNDLEVKVRSQNKEIEVLKQDNINYSREIELLKDELKKALKG